MQAESDRNDVKQSAGNLTVTSGVNPPPASFGNTPFLSDGTCEAGLRFKHLPHTHCKNSTLFMHCIAENVSRQLGDIIPPTLIQIPGRKPALLICKDHIAL